MSESEYVWLPPEPLFWTTTADVETDELPIFIAPKSTDPPVTDILASCAIETVTLIVAELAANAPAGETAITITALIIIPNHFFILLSSPLFIAFPRL
jgi:hypothetical protein